MDDDIQRKLDLIQSRRESILNQTPAEYNAERVKEYYEEVLQAKKVKDDAPSQLKNAQDNYYKARFGDKYMDIQLQMYTAESREVTEAMMDAHQKQLTEVDYKINNYSASTTYFKNINEVKKTWMDKVKKWIQQIRNSTASLNNRKTFYAEDEQVTLSNWILFENCFILSFIIVTLLLGYSQLNKLKIIGLIALTCIVFFTNTMITWLRYLPKSVTYYTQWGYDPMESKIPWFLLISLVLFGAICIVYVDVISSFFSNMKENVNRYRRGEPLRWNTRPQPQPQWRRDSSGRWVRVGPSPVDTSRLNPGIYRPTPRELEEARRALALRRALGPNRSLEERRVLERRALERRDLERRALERRYLERAYGR